MQLNKHIAALCIGTFCLGVAELGIVPVLTAIANDFHVTIPQAGLYISSLLMQQASAQVSSVS